MQIANHADAMKILLWTQRKTVYWRQSPSHFPRNSPKMVFVFRSGECIRNWREQNDNHNVVIL